MGDSNGNKEEQRNSQKYCLRKITNANQVKEFKMAEGKTWEGTFQGKCPKSRVKCMGLFVCPRFHIKGECWDVGCKYSKTHLPASAVPNNVKKEYSDYMDAAGRSHQTPNRESGRDLAVSDLNQSESPQTFSGRSSH